MSCGADSTHSPPKRRGIALLVALVALLLLSSMALALQHMVRGDFQRSRDEPIMRRALNAADAGAFDLLRRWGQLPHESLAVGGIIGPDTMQLTGAEAVTRSMRTSRTAFWTVSEGTAGDSIARTLARRIVQVAYKLAIPVIPANAALTVRDSVTLAGSARVVGTDTALAAWGGTCSSLTHTAAVAMPDTLRLCDGWCGAGSGGGRVMGLPPLLDDSAAADTARYRVFGGESWSTLTRHATHVLPGGSVVTPAPVATGGVCDRARADNWGDPDGAGACAHFAPLIWARGDLEIRGGTGQGMLLVDGDLTLSAGARLAGVVIVRDDLRTLGTGGTILGAVLAEDARVASGDHTRLDGSTLVQRSRCAVDRALEWSARLVRVRDRAWAAIR